MMTATSNYTTPQESFWAGSFGTEYISRNDSSQLLASNLNFFAKALRQAGKISSCLELGANIGMNLKRASASLPCTRTARVLRSTLMRLNSSGT